MKDKIWCATSLGSTHEVICYHDISQVEVTKHFFSEKHELSND